MFTKIFSFKTAIVNLNTENMLYILYMNVNIQFEILVESPAYGINTWNIHVTHLRMIQTCYISNFHWICFREYALFCGPNECILSVPQMYHDIFISSWVIIFFCKLSSISTGADQCHSKPETEKCLQAPSKKIIEFKVTSSVVTLQSCCVKVKQD